jgi:hypothetical protein
VHLPAKAANLCRDLCACPLMKARSSRQRFPPLVVLSRPLRSRFLDILPWPALLLRMKKPDTEELLQLVRDLAEKDAVESRDNFASVADRDELEDIADDAWNHAAIPELEWKFCDDPKSPYAALGVEFIHSRIEKLSLSRAYIAAFSSAAIEHFKLKL